MKSLVERVKGHRAWFAVAVAVVLLLVAGVTVTVLALEYDLTTVNSWYVINGAVYRAYSPVGSSGTGQFPSFLRIQANQGVVAGYNTDGTVEFETAAAQTESLLLSDVPIVGDPDAPGYYREFQLDINQTGGGPPDSYITLDTIELYLTTNPNITGYPFGLTPIYNMDAGGNNWVILNSDLSAGSGKRDLTLRVPANLFGSDPNCLPFAAGCTTYVVLYCRFGGDLTNTGATFPNNDGFEEWGNEIYLGSKSGTKFNDLNMNGIWDAGEPGLPGWTIYVDYSGNGAYDPGEPSAVTDANGAYTIAGIMAGTWDVREVNQPGWVCSHPVQSCVHTQVFEPDGVYTDNNFGNYQEPATKSGYKWNDLNADGLWDPGEPGLNGWTINVTDPTGAPVASTVTADDPGGSPGYYTFTLPAGAYTVSEVCQPGWEQSWPTPTNGCGSGVYDITLEPGQQEANNNFGNFQNVDVTACKDEDADGDIGTPGDRTPLADWPVYLSINGQRQIPGAVTDAQGCFTWTDLVPGPSYDVEEDLLPGWVNLTPLSNDFGPSTSGGSYSFTFINAQEPGTIIVEKQTIPSGSLQLFDFTSDYGPPFQLSDGQTNNSGPLQPGTYSVFETEPPGWTLIIATCDDGSDPSAIDLQAGETVTCIFENAQQEGNIIVEKQTVPDGSPQSFTFTPSYGAQFQLTDGQTNNSGPLAPGTYSVSETEPPGWTLTSAVCSDQSDPGAIDLQAGETVTCVFTNTQQEGNIIVEKQTIPDGSPQVFTFTPSYGAAFPLSDGQTNNSGPLPPGTYSVAETVPAGWTLTSAVCSDGSPINAISLQDAETVTCVFTNTQQEGNIIVEKQTIPDGSPQVFTFTPSYGAQFQLSDGQTNNSGPLPPGTYSVAETVPAGWTLTSAVCSDGSPINAISLQDAETVTCVFTNTQQQGNIIVEKQTIPDGSPQVFTFTPSYGAQFQLSDGQTNNSGPLPPGTYSVAETVPAGWTLTSAVCSDGSPINAISLQAGETVTCVFTNTQQAGNIIVEKQTVPDGSPQSFTFTPSYGAQFQLTDGQTNNSGPLQPGTYSVAETVPAGWTLTSVFCSDESDPSAISLQNGETVTCVFTNTQLRAVTVTACKQHDQDGNLGTSGDRVPVVNWPVYLWTNGVRGPEERTVSGGCYTWTGLAPGPSYAVQEYVYSGWTALTGTYHNFGPSVSGGLYSYAFINTEEEPPPFVPEASTLLLLGSAVSGLAGYAGLQVRSRRRKQ